MKRAKKWKYKGVLAYWRYSHFMSYRSYKTFAAISDPKNAHMFTVKYALKHFKRRPLLKNNT